MVELLVPGEPKATPDPLTLEKVQSALRVPVGAASPLWFMFAGAATAGMAYWWMTRWTRPQNLEAMLDTAPVLEALVAPVPLALAELAPEARSFAPEPEEPAPEPVIVAPEPEIAAAPEPEVVVAPQPAPPPPVVEPTAEAEPLTGAALVAEVARLTGLGPTEAMPSFDEPLDERPKGGSKKSGSKKAPPEA